MILKKDPYDLLSEFFIRFGRFYNGYEIHGFDHIPKEGPALLVFYHALAPLDCYYFNFEMHRRLGRRGYGLGDRFLFKTPGIKQLVETSGGVPGTRENAIKLLKEGHIVGVAPGGTREAVSGSNMDYKLKWKSRKGFAEVIKELPLLVIKFFKSSMRKRDFQ
jgi:1-acyl-sn-glycerol-3-phosphate acyltransferase